MKHLNVISVVIISSLIYQSFDLASQQRFSSIREIAKKGTEIFEVKTNYHRNDKTVIRN